MRDPRPPANRQTLLCLTLLVLVKVVFVVTLADVFFYGEELEKGTAAKALLDGIGLPYHELTYHYYEGGGFVISHLKALAFLVVGENVLAHKLVAITTCLLVCWVGLRLVARHFGANAALFFGLLFVFGPASFQRVSLLSLGIHFEATVFVLLVLDRALRIAFDEGEPTVRDLVTLGVATGFGVYFSYQVVLVAAYVTLLFLLFRRSAVFGKPAVVGLASFAAGVLPLIWMATRVGGAVFDIHGTELGDSGGGLARFGEFLRSVYVGGEGPNVRGVALEGPSPVERAGAVLYPLAVLGSAVWAVGLARGADRRKACALLGFLLFWTAVYLSSAFVQGAVYHHFQFMRFAPVWVVALVVVAAALGAAPRRAVPRVGLALLLALGLIHTLSITMEGSPTTPGENWRALRETKGYDYNGFAAKLIKRRGREPEQWSALLRFRDDSRELLYADTIEEAYRQEGRDFPSVQKELEALDAEHVLDFVRGLGPYVMLKAKSDLGTALSAATAIEGEMGVTVAEALGRTGKAYAVTPGAIEAELGRTVGSLTGEVRGAYLRGIGARIYRRFVTQPYGGLRFAMKPAAARYFAASLALDASDRDEVLAGFDRERVRRSLR